MKYKCPCCGYGTFSEPPSGDYDICPVCDWEDDPVQSKDPDYVGGANGISLNQAKANFKKFDAITENAKKRVRPPKPDEL